MTVLDFHFILLYFIAFKRFIIVRVKNVCPKPKTVITHTAENMHDLETEYKITEKTMFKPYQSLADVLQRSVSQTHTHARRARIHTIVDKNL